MFYDDDDEVGLNVLRCLADILGTTCNACSAVLPPIYSNIIIYQEAQTFRAQHCVKVEVAVLGFLS